MLSLAYCFHRADQGSIHSTGGRYRLRGAAVDLLVGAFSLVPVAWAPTTCVTDADCSDGNACNGVEVCTLGTSCRAWCGGSRRVSAGAEPASVAPQTRAARASRSRFSD